MKKNISCFIQKEKYLLIVILIGTLFIYLMYGRVLKDPNALLSGAGGDGIKNYYAFVTEVSKEGGIDQLSFNYPYGESFFYTDCHPFLARTLHYLNKIFPGIEEKSIGILNILLVLNIFFTFIVLFLLLRRFIKCQWYAAIWALAIMMLQPQLDRLGGHQALSYSLAIPLTWYLIVLLYQTKKMVKYTILLFINNFIWLGTHIYLGVMACGFVFIFDLYLIIFNKEYRNGKDICLGLVRSVVPLIFFAAILSLTDMHPGRTGNPWGFYEYASSLKSIFLPSAGWFAKTISKAIPSVGNRTWEGLAYVGFATTICFIVLTVWGVIRLWKKYAKKKILKESPFEMKLFAPALCAAILFLFFSMNYPFKLGLKWLLPYISFVQGFRAVGRFAWPFYYVATVFSAYVIFIFCTNQIEKKRKYLAITIMTIAPFLMIAESIPIQRRVYKNYFKASNFFLYEYLGGGYKNAIEKINRDDYQAIIPIPYYQGSENFSRDPWKTNIKQTSQIFAYHLRTPLAASFFARSSIIESKNLMQMLAPVYYEKAIKKDIPSQKKFLIILDPKYNPLQEAELMLLNRSTFIHEEGTFMIYEIDYHTLLKREWHSEFQKFEQIKDSLTGQEGFLLSHPDSSVIYLSFDDQRNDYSLFGQGSFKKGFDNHSNEIVRLPNRKLPKGEYEVSFWAYQCGDNYGQDLLSWVFYVYENDQVIAKTNGRGTLSINGCWSLYQVPFVVTNENSYIQLVITKISVNKSFYIDELLIRPVNVDVYKKFKDEDNTEILYKNGHFIRMD